MVLIQYIKMFFLFLFAMAEALVNNLINFRSIDKNQKIGTLGLTGILLFDLLAGIYLFVLN